MGPTNLTNNFTHNYSDPAIGEQRAFYLRRTSERAPRSQTRWATATRRVDELFAKAAVETDEPKRKACTTRCRRSCTTSCPVIFLIEMPTHLCEQAGARSHHERNLAYTGNGTGLGRLGGAHGGGRAREALRLLTSGAGMLRCSSAAVAAANPRCASHRDFQLRAPPSRTGRRSRDPRRPGRARDAGIRRRAPAEFGLDRPPLERYLVYMGKVLTFDLGNSPVRKAPVADPDRRAAAGDHAADLRLDRGCDPARGPSRDHIRYAPRELDRRP